MKQAGRIGQQLYESYQREWWKNKQITEKFQKLQACTKNLPPEEGERILTLAAEIAGECEKQAYLDGIRAGVEMNREFGE